MKICLLNHSDHNGGAARAAYRIHRALLYLGQDSRMYVNQALSGDRSIIGPSGKWGRAWTNARRQFGSMVTRVLETANPVLHSPAIVPSAWPARLNNSDIDVVNLHWINYEMLSIGNIGKLRKPLVWTLHDMWPFCGAEHYTQDYRWRDGYISNNRPAHESGLDLNRWTWQRKRKHWSRHMHIVTPSHWMAECVKQSALMRDWPVTVVPNTIDIDVWLPIEKNIARQLLNLPLDVPLLLFGAIGGGSDPRKGFDLLRDTLSHLRGEVLGLHLVIFGQPAPHEPEDFGFPVHYIGHLHDDVSLRLLYNAVNLTVIPSRQDNLPNIGLESFACGTPVIAYNTCGMPDIVSHEETGYLAKPFDAEDMANGIGWILGDAKRCETLGQAARKFALEHWSPQVVVPQYLQVYKQAMSS